MDYILYLVKFVYRIRYWLLFAPAIMAVIIYIQTETMPRTYTAQSTIYTGVISGFNILSENAETSSASIQNSIMDNLLNIVHSDKTLNNVSLRLYARSMVYGDPNKDNLYIKAENYKKIYNHGKSIHHLIDKSSSNDSINEMNTYNNLVAYNQNDPKNYVYGIYNWDLPYYNRTVLKTIEAKRDGKSDMLELSYSCDDPGMAYQTLRVLNDEFIKQYQSLRFGETNNVIAYFESELARISKQLRQAEDSLTDYSVDKKVINYEEETTQVAALSTEYEIKYWDFELTAQSSEKLIADLERRMGTAATVLRRNTDFLHMLSKISTLSNQISLDEIYETSQPTNQKRDSLKNILQNTENNFYKFAEEYGEMKYTKEGVSSEAVVKEWLQQVIALEKAKAELEVMKRRKLELDKKYVYYAPVGSTLNRKERSVSISEREYFSILSALNAARLRQKSLQMTSATLQVMNDPIYPVSPLPTDRKKLVIGAYAGTFIFIIFFFLLIELIDHTLRNKLRTELLTGGKAIGAYPKPGSIRYRKYAKKYNDMATKSLANFIMTYFSPEKNNIINIISTESEVGKSFISKQLVQYFTNLGINVRSLSWHNELSSDAKEFVRSFELPDIEAPDKGSGKENVIIVEYPPLKDAALTKEILQGVNINLLIVDARHTWKNTDQIFYNRLKEMAGDTPLFFVLNKAKRDTTEEFTGLLPPYTFLRKLLYRFSQLGITANDYPKS